MNQASTRSHCIFTIHISSREPAKATIKRAKLHLVDLAGLVIFVLYTGYHSIDLVVFGISTGYQK